MRMSSFVSALLSSTLLRNTGRKSHTIDASMLRMYAIYNRSWILLNYTQSTAEKTRTPVAAMNCSDRWCMTSTSPLLVWEKKSAPHVIYWVEQRRKNIWKRREGEGRVMKRMLRERRVWSTPPTCRKSPCCQEWRCSRRRRSVEGWWRSTTPSFLLEALLLQSLWWRISGTKP